MMRAPGAVSFMATSPPHLTEKRLPLGSWTWFLSEVFGREACGPSQDTDSVMPYMDGVSEARPDWPGKASLGLVSKQNLSPILEMYW